MYSDLIKNIEITRIKKQGLIKSGLSLVLFTGLFCLLISLGLWQVSRGDARQKLEKSYVQRQHTVLSTEQLINSRDPEKLTGVRAQINLSSTHTPLIYLDNQSYKGKVGYLGYQLMQISPSKPWLLVELGFIAAYAQRDHLPQITKMNTGTTLIGRIYHTSTNPFSKKLMAERGDPMRIQNLNYQELGKLFGHSVLPYAIQPDQVFKAKDGRKLLKPWRPIAMSSEKNFGYAAQWFAMATTLAVIGFYIIWRRKSELGKAK